MSQVDVQRNLRTATQVLGAIILRNMRTRFGGSYKAYIIAILWPYTHLVVIVTAWTLLGRKAPLGTDTVTYFAIALAPFILYSYTMRGISTSIVANKPLLHFPRVKILDLIFARALLESITACVVCFVVMASLVVFGFEFKPFDYARMIAGFAGGLYFGIAVGIAWGLFCGVVKGAMFLTNLWVVTFYLTCGVFFLPDSLPNQLQYWLSYLPLMHAVELARVGYYPDFHSTILDSSYPFWYSSGLIAVALAAERIFRKYILQAH